MRKPLSSDPAYAFGSDSEAIQRLLTQGHLLNPFTQRLLEDARATRGMTVLDHHPRRRGERQRLNGSPTPSDRRHRAERQRRGARVSNTGTARWRRIPSGLDAIGAPVGDEAVAMPLPLGPQPA